MNLDPVQILETLRIFPKDIKRYRTVTHLWYDTIYYEQIDAFVVPVIAVNGTKSIYPGHQQCLVYSPHNRKHISMTHEELINLYKNQLVIKWISYCKNN